MANGVTPRPFHAFTIAPPGGDRGLTILDEPATPKLLWLLIRGVADVPEEGRKLFAKPLANQNTLWREMSNYVRQAYAYWEGRQNTPGSSASLLYYYCFLNLAKAELLTTNPTAIVGKRLGHGLSFSPTGGQTVAGDGLKVVDGIFPMLYERRTGTTLAKNSKLGIPRLLSMVPEIGLEVAQSGISRPLTIGGYHVVVNDAAAAWPLIAFLNQGWDDKSTDPAARQFRRSFERIDLQGLPINWRELFAISRRFNAWDLNVFQHKRTFSIVAKTGALPAVLEAGLSTREALSPFLSDSIRQQYEFTLAPSLLKSTRLPMPSDLARYALMYYASSLVRYKPAALDPVKQARQAWLFDSFTRECAITLLANSLAGILGIPHYYESSGYRT